jgi:hypothetical protein
MVERQEGDYGLVIRPSVKMVRRRPFTIICGRRRGAMSALASTLPKADCPLTTNYCRSEVRCVENPVANMTVRQTGVMRHLGGWHVALISRADQHRRLQSNWRSCCRENQNISDTALPAWVRIGQSISPAPRPLFALGSKRSNRLFR